MVWLKNDRAKTARCTDDLNQCYFGTGKFLMCDIFRPLLGMTIFHQVWDGSTYKALAKRTRKQTRVENLGLLATPFGQALRELALTCAHFGRDQICMQVKASFSPFGHPAEVNAS